MTSSNTGSTAWMNYYDWSSSSGSLQGYSIIVRYTLPPDFTSWATSDAIKINLCTEAASSTNSNLDIDVYLDGASSADATSSNNYSASAGVWQTVSIDDSVLGEWNAAGESGVIVLHVQSANDTYVRVGDVELNYNR